MNQLITIEDQTSEGTLTPKELFNLSWSLGYQASFHYNRSPWVEHNYAPAAHVAQLPAGAKPPEGAWNLILQDNSSEAGTLGYHEDEAGTQIPVAYAFVLTAREDGVDPAEVASHEMLEMLVDPNVTNESEVRKVLNPTAKEWVIVEVGDPVEGCGYDIGAPENRPCGVVVADFALPAWWRMPQTRPDLSFRDSVKAPFELAKGGYISVMPEAGGEWSQVYGESRNEAPKWDFRVQGL